MEVLYILVRNDMESLASESGKVAAQVAHAANQFTATVEQSLSDTYQSWKSQSSSATFGTTITLSASKKDIDKVLRMVEGKFPCGTVLDDTYPLKDGAAMHFLPVETCAYVFGMKEELEDYLDEFPLYSEKTARGYCPPCGGSGCIDRT